MRAHYDETVAPLGSEWEAVHRLDYETSGLLMASKRGALEVLRGLFQNPDSPLEKIYLAGASGVVSPEGVRDGWIGSHHRGSKKVKFTMSKDPFQGWHSVRMASHEFRSMHPETVEAQRARALGFTGHIYQVELYTGARHQIRAFFAAQNAPLVGDPLYGGPEGPRLELHAWKLRFPDPWDSSVVHEIID